MSQRIVIVGGGFGGLYAARSLADADATVTLIDRRNFHLFQPLLYQVATGGLSPANIASPLRSILKRQRNVRVIMSEVHGFKVADRAVVTADGDVPYDALIVAAGAGNNYFGHDEWRLCAPGLKTVEDATGIRARIFKAFEAAEKENDAAKVRALLTFVIVGSGPTGVELAGAIAEIARDTLRRDFRKINPVAASILLLDAGDRVLKDYEAPLPEKARRQLQKLGVTVRTGARVKAIEESGITIGAAAGGADEHVRARCIFWAAGVRASPLGAALAQATGAEMDRMGRLSVEADCSLKGHAEIFVIGDMARLVQDGRELPGVAPVAMQEGHYVARLLMDRAARRKTAAFRYRDKGSMATIGRAAAVARVGRWRFSGYTAWLLWLFVHLMYIVQFQNRLLILTQWAWNYFTRNRSARLITEVPEKE